MVEIKPVHVLDYLTGTFGNAKIRKIFPLGAGAHGEGYRVLFEVDGAERALIVKSIFPEDFGHEYPADRAQVLIQAHMAYNRMDGHVKSLDVLGLGPHGTVPIGDAEEFFIVMEEAEGTSYFADLDRIRTEGVTDLDRQRVGALADRLAEMHSSKIDNPMLYRRKIRDTVGHGECLMGVLDTYPRVDFTSEIEMVQLVMKAVKWWGRIRDRGHRLSVVHGDFHPGNIWWNGDSFTLLDRSRGLYGEPADDLTALTINYIFYDLQVSNDFNGPYRELFDAFFDRYLHWTNDEEAFEVMAPFYAFRAAVVASPTLYPDVPDRVRRKLFNFAQNVLDEQSFDRRNVAAYFSRM